MTALDVPIHDLMISMARQVPALVGTGTGNRVRMFLEVVPQNRSSFANNDNVAAVYGYRGGSDIAAFEGRRNNEQNITISLLVAKPGNINKLQQADREFFEVMRAESRVTEITPVTSAWNIDLKLYVFSRDLIIRTLTNAT